MSKSDFLTNCIYLGILSCLPNSSTDRVGVFARLSRPVELSFSSISFRLVGRNPFPSSDKSTPSESPHPATNKLSARQQGARRNIYINTSEQPVVYYVIQNTLNVSANNAAKNDHDLRMRVKKCSKSAWQIKITRFNLGL